MLTTGTGSGKSLAYIVPIVDRVLREREATAASDRPGVKAIVVYPMNALANSQLYELEKFLELRLPARARSRSPSPATPARRTTSTRRRILADPPDILLTNYVMLELVLTRPDERSHLIRAAQGLRFLVLDELHTYRGRQGADVALLVRRLRDVCASPEPPGASAPPPPWRRGGSVAEQKARGRRGRHPALRRRGHPDRVIGETLTRATSADGTPTPRPRPMPSARARSPSAPTDLRRAADRPAGGWVESTFGLDEEPDTGRLVRRTPTTVRGRRAGSPTATGVDPATSRGGDPATPC